MKQPIIIKPHKGIEGLPLGIERSEVIDILGKPEDRSKMGFPDGSYDEDWEYLQLHLQLTFSSDDNWLLGVITVESEKAELAGHHLIGLDEMAFLKTLRQANIGPAVLDDDFKDLGSKDYVCGKLGLSFWVQDGIVTSITIFPKYDKSGNVPLWPEKNAPKGHDV